MRPVPDDVLSHIFDAIARDEPLPWPNAVYDQQRARLPFVLAAICRRWRDLARDTSSLWTYFGFPSDPSSGGLDAQLERLCLLRSLSKSQPVDVIIEPSKRQYQSQIINALDSLGSRWRSATLKIFGTHTTELDSAMAGHSPFLQSLSLWFDADLVVLPRAPLLERAYLESFALAVDIASLCLPSLTNLALLSEGQACRLFNPPLCAGLRELCIIDDLLVLPNAPSVFPCLQSLTLEDPGFLNYIQAAKLKQLHLNCTTLHNEHISAISQFTELDHLGLFGDILPDGTDALSALSSIRSLSIGTPLIVRWALQEDMTTIRTRTFVKLTRAVPPVWSRLEQVRLGNFSFEEDGTYSQDEFIAFIETRRLGVVVTAPNLHLAPTHLRVEVDPKVSSSVRQHVQDFIQTAGL
ncbi:hypothetical protein BKA62DRAFT_724252 [Auriculariales sp. MPI-PUGE-AT-0066]|nr:hypothetical protein BKA62DRAFT_724252 [Auriculariales sp. MPI-PUGE-AT-0066]